MSKIKFILLSISLIKSFSILSRKIIAKIFLRPQIFKENFKVN